MHLDLIDEGDHYRAMIEQGISRGVAWLKRLAGLDPAGRKPAA